MPEPKKGEKGNEPTKKGGEGDETISQEDFQALQKQVENLNKGIASYRDELSSTKEELSKTKELNQELEKKVTDTAEEEVDLSEKDKKRLEKWAEQEGFVTAQELQKKEQELKQQNIRTVENQAIDEFLQEHPEYDEDDNWETLKEEFQLYRQPTSLQSYRKLLNRIHNTLSGGEEAKKGENRARAKMKAKGRLTLGGGSQGSPSEEETEMSKLQEKYPNLSESQIKARMNELNSIFTEEKEEE